MWSDIVFLISTSQMKYEGDFKELIYTQHKEEVFKIMVRFAVLGGIRYVLEHIFCGHVERL